MFMLVILEDINLHYHYYIMLDLLILVIVILKEFLEWKEYIFLMYMIIKKCKNKKVELHKQSKVWNYIRKQ